jgi:hypothetical protein
MKNTFLSAIIALFIGVSASAQSTVDSIAAKYKLLPMPAPLTTEKIFPVLGTYQLSTDAAVAGSTAVSSTSTTSTTIADQTTTATDVAAVATPAITITLDSASKGIVWVEGLPEGKFKAYLKKSPTTYRIISQTTNMGKQIPEGTMHFDAETNALHIAMGKAYNDEDPTGIFAVNAAPEATTEVASNTKSKSKTAKTAKSKVTFYTASKLVTEPTPVEEAQGGGTAQQGQ